MLQVKDGEGGGGGWDNEYERLMRRSIDVAAATVAFASKMMTPRELIHLQCATLAVIIKSSEGSDGDIVKFVHDLLDVYLSIVKEVHWGEEAS